MNHHPRHDLEPPRTAAPVRLAAALVLQALVALPAFAGACDAPAGRVLEVGPGKEFALPSFAAEAARRGDTVRIAAGDYRGDVAVWNADELKICGVGGRPRLYADGNSAQGKAIWVIGGADVTVENIEFRNAKVPDLNGAGIRAQGGNLTVRDSAFFDNENGILGGDGAVVTIERSEFGRNGAGDGQSHNIYIGFAARLVVTASYFHEAKSGHNLKSRARESRIENSYFIDGPKGHSSYLADFPSGGAVFLRGNLFHKGPEAENETAVSFGAEGMKWPVNTLDFVHNTVVMTRPGGWFIAARPATQALSVTYNLFSTVGGAGLVSGGVPAEKVTLRSNMMAQVAAFPGADKVAAPSFWPTLPLGPLAVLSAVADPEYLQDAPRPLATRPIKSGARMIGALQSKP